jgi:ribosomal protein L9
MKKNKREKKEKKQTLSEKIKCLINFILKPLKLWISSKEFTKKKFTSYITARAIIVNYKTENLTLFRETMIIQQIEQFGQYIAFLKVKSKWNVQKPLSFGDYVNEKQNQALKL